GLARRYSGGGGRNCRGRSEEVTDESEYGPDCCEKNAPSVSRPVSQSQGLKTRTGRAGPGSRGAHGSMAVAIGSDLECHVPVGAPFLSRRSTTDGRSVSGCAPSSGGDLRPGVPGKPDTLARTKISLGSAAAIPGGG